MLGLALLPGALHAEEESRPSITTLIVTVATGEALGLQGVKTQPTELLPCARRVGKIVMSVPCKAAVASQGR